MSYVIQPQIPRTQITLWPQEGEQILAGKVQPRMARYLMEAVDVPPGLYKDVRADLVQFAPLPVTRVAMKYASHAYTGIIDSNGDPYFFALNARGLLLKKAADPAAAWSLFADLADTERAEARAMRRLNASQEQAQFVIGLEKSLLSKADKWTSAGGVIVNGDGKLCLIKPKGGYGGYNWTFPKGRVEHGHTLEQTVHKEIGEEAGVTAKLGPHLGSFAGSYSNTHYFLMEQTGVDDSLRDDETEEVRFVTPEEAATLLHTERDLQVLDHAVLTMAAHGKVHKKPYGHTAYIRQNKSGKLSQVKAKGVKPTEVKPSTFKFKPATETAKPAPADDDDDDDVAPAYFKVADLGGGHGGATTVEDAGVYGIATAVKNACKQLGIVGTTSVNLAAQQAKVVVDAETVYMADFDDDDTSLMMYKLAPSAAKKHSKGAPNVESTDDDDVKTTTKPMQFTPTGEFAGSNDGQWYTDDEGQRWFGKQYSGHTDRVASEYLTNQLYELFGVAVPETQLVEINGKQTVLAKKVDGKKFKGPADLASHSDVVDHFVIDAWLANWDVVGQEYDNILNVHGMPVRIDGGGALVWRAMGGNKPFAADVPELKSMLNPSYPAGQVFGKTYAKEKALRAGLADFEEKYTTQMLRIIPLLEKLPMSPALKQEIRQGLKDRASYLIDKYHYLADSSHDSYSKAFSLHDTINLLRKALPSFSAWVKANPGKTHADFVSDHNHLIPKTVVPVGGHFFDAANHVPSDPGAAAAATAQGALNPKGIGMPKKAKAITPSGEVEGGKKPKAPKGSKKKPYGHVAYVKQGKRGLIYVDAKGMKPSDIKQPHVKNAGAFEPLKLVTENPYEETEDDGSPSLAHDLTQSIMEEQPRTLEDLNMIIGHYVGIYCKVTPGYTLTHARDQLFAALVTEGVVTVPKSQLEPQAEEADSDGWGHYASSYSGTVSDMQKPTGGGLTKDEARYAYKAIGDWCSWPTEPIAAHLRGVFCRITGRQPETDLKVIQISHKGNSGDTLPKSTEKLFADGYAGKEPPPQQLIESAILKTVRHAQAHYVSPFVEDEGTDYVTLHRGVNPNIFDPKTGHVLAGTLSSWTNKPKHFTDGFGATMVTIRVPRSAIVMAHPVTPGFLNENEVLIASMGSIKVDSADHGGKKYNFTHTFDEEEKTEKSLARKRSHPQQCVPVTIAGVPFLIPSGPAMHGVDPEDLATPATKRKRVSVHKVLRSIERRVAKAVFVIDLEKAGTGKKPYGHTAYTRKNKSGKLSQVKAKGTKPSEAPDAAGFTPVGVKPQAQPKAKKPKAAEPKAFGMPKKAKAITPSGEVEGGISDKEAKKLAKKKLKEESEQPVASIQTTYSGYHFDRLVWRMKKIPESMGLPPLWKKLIKTTRERYPEGKEQHEQSMTMEDFHKVVAEVFSEVFTAPDGFVAATQEVVEQLIDAGILDAKLTPKKPVTYSRALLGEALLNTDTKVAVETINVFGNVLTMPKGAAKYKVGRAEAQVIRDQFRGLIAKHGLPVREAAAKPKGGAYEVVSLKAGTLACYHQSGLIQATTGSHYNLLSVFKKLNADPAAPLKQDQLEDVSVMIHETLHSTSPMYTREHWFTAIASSKNGIRRGMQFEEVTTEIAARVLTAREFKHNGGDPDETIKKFGSDTERPYASYISNTVKALMHVAGLDEESACYAVMRGALAVKKDMTMPTKHALVTDPPYLPGYGKTMSGAWVEFNRAPAQQALEHGTNTFLKAAGITNPDHIEALQAKLWKVS